MCMYVPALFSAQSFCTVSKYGMKAAKMLKLRKAGIFGL
jgi:hypothetical protein